MGSYLDKPETSKKSTLEENEFLVCGSSSMQGWRINQEDAHNALLNFDYNTAFFAVYDGHGGSEVAEYCSMKLPDFLRHLKSFEEGDFDKALIDTFLGFDATLLEENVVEELKMLAKKNPDYDGDDSDAADDDDNEEVLNLQMEATMPLKEVLEKYKGNIAVQKFMQILPKKNEHGETSGPSGASSSSVSNAEGRNTASIIENEVSSTNTKLKASSEQTDLPSSSSGPTAQPAPDSTANNIPNSTKTVAGSISEKSDTKVEAHQINNSINDSDNAISSSSTPENGENKNDAPSSSSAAKITIKEPKTSDGGSGGSGSSYCEKASPIVTSHNLSDIDPESSSDDENDKTYKESSKCPKPVDSDGDTTDEDVEEGLEEEADDEEDELSEEEEDDFLNNEFMDNMESGPGKASGCTAVVALLNMKNKQIIVANAGDSRCIICRAGKALEMSFDHKPEDEIEFERIKKAGGRVTLDGRVNGGLNLSRAIGDHGYKMNKGLKPEEQMISASPDLKHHTLDASDEFMVLACDGIWNYMSNEDVVGFVKQRIDAGKHSLSEICEELFHNCLAPNTVGDGTGCDNMTAIIVKFKPTIFASTSSHLTESNLEVQKSSGKRVCDENEAVPASQKKPKIDDDLTPAAVDTSTA